MSRTETFIDDLVGVHDLTHNGGSVLARRYTMNIVGGRVEDVGGVVQITLAQAPVWLATDTLTGDQDDYGPTDFTKASEVPVDMAANRIITGFNSDNLTVFRKRIWNDDSAQTLTIPHNDSGSLAANRVYTPGGVDMVLSAGEVANISWSDTDGHWRGYKCSI